MKTEIYYFSGTGNSLAISRQLAESLEGTVSILPISGYENEQTVKIETDVLGIVFPTYFQSVPGIVKRFINKLDFTKQPYIFSVATCNAEPGHCLYTVKRLLSKKSQVLSAGFTVDMPGNAYMIVDNTNPPEIQNERLKNSEIKVSDISGLINNRCKNTAIEGTDKAICHIKGFIHNTVVTMIYKTPQKFRVTGNCTKCGLCARICPVKNITTSNDGKQRWGNECENCLACLHWCPEKAIEMGRDTLGRQRYHHPEVSAGDMILK
ncbi:MAG: 4Fe-4S dicluster domain-containing protein [Clostridia bacterium]|nr:4Fe-4S dicluster domain-containing protein [Clostridia bacterium]